ncbi:phosphoribosylanthranilate isomerase [bacterium]|nr:phosphoribosylanthranilate isomerase [bacterium]MBU1753355.1 phosphoribosylanthranilate isomerase [bacterium]
MQTIAVKICGITNIEDALLAVEAGADALGFIFAKKSSRLVNEEIVKRIIKQIPPFVTTVGVFVNESLNVVQDIVEYCSLDIVQLHGNESPQYCSQLGRRVIKAFRIQDAASLLELPKYHVCGYLLDTFVEGSDGGTGKRFDWNLATEAKKYGRIILAGGLNPENVAEAIVQIEPYGVDVSSGVECLPGKKDRAKMMEFVRRVNL